jgi:aerobic carbon-monoxide dehydrogenase large subunit
MDDTEPALESTRYFRIGNVYHQPEKQGRFSTYPTWPYGAAACVVEVDPDTGHVKVLRYCLIHDAGKTINPLLADANLHGGITQGIGGAIYEDIVYDEAGQPLTSTFMDYTIPTAVEMPMFELGHEESLCPFTPLGTKGVGESGVGAALGALCRAVEDAFPGSTFTSRPCRSRRIASLGGDPRGPAATKRVVSRRTDPQDQGPD